MQCTNIWSTSCKYKQSRWSFLGNVFHFLFYPVYINLFVLCSVAFYVYIYINWLTYTPVFFFKLTCGQQKYIYIWKILLRINILWLWKIKSRSKVNMYQKPKLVYTGKWFLLGRSTDLPLQLLGKKSIYL